MAIHQSISLRLVSMNAKLKEWLPIILALISVAVMWGTMQARQVATDLQITELKVKLATMDATTMEVRLQLTEMRRDLVYIREEIDALADLHLGGR